ncbi:hypothetical protein ASPBRDRAFT_332533 [Aspergillus brasiliensis CBS 101740]|uniref:Uncharacterized protein n=1 Tax=Aspergillus brasiliensis (strain CBS 101740 / IMI 381727 / IBT 21946) TaxID=767769 RepID=A0A1L9U7B1_ASPBC|nr:hypothetical protein ASPBRDRAFT_332533 [Aspergillus brasiliensis CBS 101740]
MCQSMAAACILACGTGVLIAACPVTGGIPALYNHSSMQWLKAVFFGEIYNLVSSQTRRITSYSSACILSHYPYLALQLRAWTSLPHPAAEYPSFTLKRPFLPRRMSPADSIREILLGSSGSGRDLQDLTFDRSLGRSSQPEGIADRRGSGSRASKLPGSPPVSPEAMLDRSQSMIDGVSCICLI